MQTQHLPLGAHVPSLPLAPHPAAIPGSSAAGLMAMARLPVTSHHHGSVKDEKSEQLQTLLIIVSNSETDWN